MERLELIKARPADPGDRRRAADLIGIIMESGIDLADLQTGRLSHAILPGDLGMTLFWDNESPRGMGTHPGPGPGHESPQVGMVNHSMWNWY